MARPLVSGAPPEAYLPIAWILGRWLLLVGVNAWLGYTLAVIYVSGSPEAHLGMLAGILSWALVCAGIEVNCREIGDTQLIGSLYWGAALRAGLQFFTVLDVVMGYLAWSLMHALGWAEQGSIMFFYGVTMLTGVQVAICAALLAAGVHWLRR